MDNQFENKHHHIYNADSENFNLNKKAHIEEIYMCFLPSQKSQLTEDMTDLSKEDLDRIYPLDYKDDIDLSEIASGKIYIHTGNLKYYTLEKCERLIVSIRESHLKHYDINRIIVDNRILEKYFEHKFLSMTYSALQLYAKFILHTELLFKEQNHIFTSELFLFNQSDNHKASYTETFSIIDHQHTQRIFSMDSVPRDIMLYEHIPEEVNHINVLFLNIGMFSNKDEMHLFINQSVSIMKQFHKLHGIIIVVDQQSEQRENIVDVVQCIANDGREVSMINNSKLMMLYDLLFYLKQYRADAFILNFDEKKPFISGYYPKIIDKLYEADIRFQYMTESVDDDVIKNERELISRFLKEYKSQDYMIICDEREHILSGRSIYLLETLMNALDA